MIDKIHAKLQQALFKDTPDEVEALYILALARKILEAHNLRKRFPLLNFFCNWALHYRIDDISFVEDELNGLIQGRADKVLTMSESFFKQFLEFLEYEKLTNKIIPTKFIFTVMNVCAYSPLIVASLDREKKVRITLLENILIPGSIGTYSWQVHIEDIDE